MPVTAYYLSPSGDLRHHIDEEEIRSAYMSGEGLLWVDIAETTEEDGEFLERIFAFHPLTIADCLSSLIHPPRVTNFGLYIYFNIHGVDHAAESAIVETAELALFLGPHFVVTNHNSPLYSVESVKQAAGQDGQPMRSGADFLAHAILDALIGNVLPTIERMSDVADEVEEEAIRNPLPSTLETVLLLKRSTLGINRAMAPQVNVLNRLSRGEFALVRPEARLYYQDVSDQLYRIESLNQSLRERADNALATYLSSVANRQNETMRMLAIVAATFLPLGLVAGIYGMNFDYIPELHYRWGYFIVIGFMAVIIGVMGWIFWVRRWFAWGRRRVPGVRSFAVDPEKILGYVGNLARGSRRQS